MKWFKHDSDAFMSEGVAAIVDEFGFAGYGRWMRLLEIVAFKMDGSSRCYVEFPIKKLSSLLGLKHKKLIYFLEVTEKQLKTKVTRVNNMIKIEIPNLLKKRDNYTKDLEVKRQQLPSIERDKEIERDIEREVEKKEKEVSLKRHVAPLEIDLGLCDLLQDAISRNNDKFIPPKNFNAWADDCRKMRTIDKRSEVDIKTIIHFSQSNDFWKNNIMSMGKLRKQFMRLWGEYQGGNNKLSKAGMTTALNAKRILEKGE